MDVKIKIAKIKEEIFKNSLPEGLQLESNKLKLGVSTDFKYTPQNEEFVVRLIITFNYLVDEEPTEIMEFITSNHFYIFGMNDALRESHDGDKEELEEFLNSNSKLEDSLKFDVPLNILYQLISIAYSTARGMLIYKMSGTPMSALYLPILHPKDILPASQNESDQEEE